MKKRLSLVLAGALLLVMPAFNKQAVAQAGIWCRTRCITELSICFTGDIDYCLSKYDQCVSGCENSTQ